MGILSYIITIIVALIILIILTIYLRRSWGFGGSRRKLPTTLIARDDETFTVLLKASSLARARTIVDSVSRHLTLWRLRNVVLIVEAQSDVSSEQSDYEDYAKDSPLGVDIPFDVRRLASSSASTEDVVRRVLLDEYQDMFVLLIHEASFVADVDPGLIIDDMRKHDDLQVVTFNQFDNATMIDDPETLGAAAKLCQNIMRPDVPQGQGFGDVKHTNQNTYYVRSPCTSLSTSFFRKKSWLDSMSRRSLNRTTWMFGHLTSPPVVTLQ
jgi:hypothetical protein